MSQERWDLSPDELEHAQAAFDLWRLSDAQAAPLRAKADAIMAGPSARIGGLVVALCRGRAVDPTRVGHVRLEAGKLVLQVAEPAVSASPATTAGQPPKEASQ